MQHARRINQAAGISFNQRPRCGQEQPDGALVSDDCQATEQLPDLPPLSASMGGKLAATGPVNNLLAQLHAERMARQAQRAGASASLVQAEMPQLQQERKAAEPLERRPQSQAVQQQQHQASPAPQRLTLLTWNVWFRQDVAIQERMAAIGAMIAEKQPHFVCLQVCCICSICKLRFA
jgi:hypothetical protein